MRSWAAVPRCPWCHLLPPPDPCRRLPLARSACPAWPMPACVEACTLRAWRPPSLACRWGGGASGLVACQGAVVVAGQLAVAACMRPLLPRRPWDAPQAWQHPGSQQRCWPTCWPASHATAHRHPAACPATQTLSGVYRGQRDFLDTAHGGMAAGAVFGLSRERGAAAWWIGAGWAGGPGSGVLLCGSGCTACLQPGTPDRACCQPPPCRTAVHRSTGARGSLLRSLVLGSALGASLGVPFGLLHDKVVRATWTEGAGWRSARARLRACMQ